MAYHFDTFMKNKEMEKNSIAIIGCGLCGSAMTIELVKHWKENLANKNPQYIGDSNISKIYVTTLTKNELEMRLKRIKNSLEDDKFKVISKKDKLLIKENKYSLEIIGKTLSIIPKYLDKQNLTSEEFLKNSQLYKFIKKIGPSHLIIGANLAAIIAYSRNINDSDILAWIMGTIKYSVDSIGIVKNFLIFGTTALGGMSDKIPFSHGPEPKFNPHLNKKIIAAGGLLELMDRYQAGNSKTKFIHLMPGALLGVDEYGFGDLSYFNVPEGIPKELEKEIKSNLKVPLFKPYEINLKKLSDKKINWKKLRIKEGKKPAYLKGVYAKFGESGKITIDQLGVITDPRLMGFISAERVAKIALAELTGKTTGHNMVPLGAGDVIEPDSESYQYLTKIVNEIDNQYKKEIEFSAPNTPELGGTRFQVEIATANILYHYLSEVKNKKALKDIVSINKNELAEGMWNYLFSHPLYFAQIVAVTPIISPKGFLYIGPYLMLYETGIEKENDLSFLKDSKEFENLAENGAVDLRIKGIGRLTKKVKGIIDNYIKKLPENIVASLGTSFGKDDLIWHDYMHRGNGNTLYNKTQFVIEYLCENNGERPFT